MKLPAQFVDGFDDCQLNWEAIQNLFASLPITTGSWITPTLLNSWTNAGGGNENAGYLKDPLGFVHLKGVLNSTGTTTGNAAFTLAAGYRPGATTLTGLGTSNFGEAIVEITSAGAVTMFYASGAANSFMGLSGITFLAEN